MAFDDALFVTVLQESKCCPRPDKLIRVGLYAAKYHREMPLGTQQCLQGGKLKQPSGFHTIAWPRAAGEKAEFLEIL